MVNTQESLSFDSNLEPNVESNVEPNIQEHPLPITPPQDPKPLSTADDFGFDPSFDLFDQIYEDFSLVPYLKSDTGESSSVMFAPLTSLPSEESLNNLL